MRRGFIILWTCLVGLLIVSQGPLAYDPPPEVTVTNVWFYGWTGSSALNIRKNATIDVATPEWYPALDRYEPVAYVMNTSPGKVGGEVHCFPAFRGLCEGDRDRFSGGSGRAVGELYGWPVRLG
ncbi:MAG TPA: hypothetical protein EYP53_02740 [Candidatus Latescibacteria bacterium]|nr:hypothetical protein [Candidatus Latescibacterota bacterium]